MRTINPRISRAPEPVRPAGQAPRPTDTFTLDSPDKAVVFPAMNPLLLKAIEFDTEMAGMGGADLQAPIHLTVGQASGDLTYQLPYAGGQMKAQGTFAGQPLDETWTFGSQFKIDGHYGAAEEHLTIGFDDKGWHITGQVGQYGVKEDITEWDKDGKSGYTVDGQIGGQAVHQEYTSTQPGADGSWQTTMQGPQGSAQSQFQTLKDRHQFTAQGQTGSTAWTASGQLIFTPDPNAPPPEG